MERNKPVTSSKLLLDHVGEVVLTLNSDGLSWKSVDFEESESRASSSLGMKSKTGTDIKFSDVYAVEFIKWGLIHELIPSSRGSRLGTNSEMYRFVVHGFQRSKVQNSPWVLSSFTFGHKDLQKCQAWIEQISAYINMEVGRPKSLLVFVHPLCGKGKGRKTWDTVAPLFSRAKVKTKVILTQRAGHAFSMLTSITDRELSSYDGIVSVGGDGLFNEVLNGLLSSRYKAPYPPAPTELMHSAGNNDPYQWHRLNHRSNDRAYNDISATGSETKHKNGNRKPLLSTSESNEVGISKFKTEAESCNTDQGSVFSFPNEWFRLGIIPAGSTDAIVISTTGTRDPVTSALHIIFGKRMSLDIAQIVRWKTSPSSMDMPYVCYAASFAGYGFYGDVIKESEKYRWMGPKRYDYAGTKVFLKHRTYEAEIAFLDVTTVEPIAGIGTVGRRTRPLRLSQEDSNKMVCRVNCIICNGTMEPAWILVNRAPSRSGIHAEDSRWLQCKGRFLSVGAAIISCRNERAPDGLVADAHLADGFLHLILVKDCPHPSYLWHLIQLTKKGSKPLNFEFVEHHKTTAFTFLSHHDESIWNLDGELFQACQLSAQVCRGLINLFASGPEV